jgi:hypothetical protein
MIPRNVTRTYILASTADKFIGAFPSIVGSFADTATYTTDRSSCSFRYAAEGAFDVALGGRIPSVRTSLCQISNGAWSRVGHVITSFARSACSTLSSIAGRLRSTLRSLVDFLRRRGAVAARRRVEFTWLRRAISMMRQYQLGDSSAFALSHECLASSAAFHLFVSQLGSIEAIWSGWPLMSKRGTDVPVADPTVLFTPEEAVSVVLLTALPAVPVVLLTALLAVSPAMTVVSLALSLVVRRRHSIEKRWHEQQDLGIRTYQHQQASSQA